MKKNTNGVTITPLFDLRQFEASRALHPDSVDLEDDSINIPSPTVPGKQDNLQSLIEKISCLEKRIKELEKSSVIEPSQNQITEPESAESFTEHELESSSVIEPSQNRITEPAIRIWLEEYPKKSHFYLKLVWLQPPGKRHHKHVRGGNITSPTIQKKRQQIAGAIALKFPLPEIMKLCL